MSPFQSLSLSQPNFNPAYHDTQPTTASTPQKYGARRESWANVVDATHESNQNTNSTSQIVSYNGPGYKNSPTLKAYDKSGQLRDLAMSDSGIVIVPNGSMTGSQSGKSEFILVVSE